MGGHADVFDRREATFTEKQCREWVKSMSPSTRPEAEPPPELDDDDEGGGESFSARKNLRRLFVRGGREHIDFLVRDPERPRKRERSAPQAPGEGRRYSNVIDDAVRTLRSSPFAFDFPLPFALPFAAATVPVTVAGEEGPQTFSWLALLTALSART